MKPKFKIRYADVPMSTWEGERVTNDFDEALSLLKEFCAAYDVVDFQMRYLDIEGADNHE